MAIWYYLQKAMNNKTNKTIFDYRTHFETTSELHVKTDTDIHSKCRVCLQSSTAQIYNGDNAESIIDVLQLVTGDTINEHDDKPKALCSVCYDFIKTIVIFRKVAKQTQDILKQPLKIESNNLDDVDLIDHNYTDEDIFDTKPPENDWSRIRGDVIKQEKKKCSSKVTCHICSKVINRSYFKEHVTIHDPDHKKYVCDVCGKSFRLRCAYHNHSLRHSNDFPYKCTFCPYRGRYAELLKTHMRTHTGDYRYMCTECPARFLFKSNLNSHMLKHKEPQFKCDTCKRAFHSTLALQRHYEADHLGIKNHVCNVCGKAFGYRNAMMKHQRHVHKREKMLFGRMPSYLEEEQKKQNEMVPVNSC
ncbi:unnamed protein product [Chilo suppressalis]|uniref:Protein krueppel n=1 Tax=Chilo suppressalis TaxID=168631 RepID=A0ABN8B1L5_CHISP|nr:unnamed protein product [Chilo suppressalis]